MSSDSLPLRLSFGESGKARASCRPDEAVMGGGFRGTHGGAIGFAAYPTVLMPVDDGDEQKVPDDGWQVKAQNGTTTSMRLQALAVCRRP